MHGMVITGSSNMEYTVHSTTKETSARRSQTQAGTQAQAGTQPSSQGAHTKRRKCYLSPVSKELVFVRARVRVCVCVCVQACVRAHLRTGGMQHCRSAALQEAQHYRNVQVVCLTCCRVP